MKRPSVRTQTTFHALRGELAGFTESQCHRVKTIRPLVKIWKLTPNADSYLFPILLVRNADLPTILKWRPAASRHLDLEKECEFLSRFRHLFPTPGLFFRISIPP